MSISSYIRHNGVNKWVRVDGQETVTINIFCWWLIHLGSFTLVKKFKKIHITPLHHNRKLIFLNIISLFTYEPVSLAMESMDTNFHEVNSTINKNLIIKAINYILINSFLIFDKLTYKKTYGCPTSSPLSPVISDLTIFKLETEVLIFMNFKILVYIRYVSSSTFVRTEFGYPHNVSEAMPFEVVIQLSLHFLGGRPGGRLLSGISFIAIFASLSSFIRSTRSLQCIRRFRTHFTTSVTPIFSRFLGVPHFQTVPGDHLLCLHFCGPHNMFSSCCFNFSFSSIGLTDVL